MSLLLLFGGGGGVVSEDFTYETASPVTVLPGSSYSAVAYLQTGTNTRMGTLSINWYNASSVFISASSGSAVSVTNSAWVQSKASGTAPATAAKATVSITIASAVAGEVCYTDDIGLYRMSAPTPY